MSSSVPEMEWAQFGTRDTNRKCQRQSVQELCNLFFSLQCHQAAIQSYLFRCRCSSPLSNRTARPSSLRRAGSTLPVVPLVSRALVHKHPKKLQVEVLPSRHQLPERLVLDQNGDVLLYPRQHDSPELLVVRREVIDGRHGVDELVSILGRIEALGEFGAGEGVKRRSLVLKRSGAETDKV